MGSMSWKSKVDKIQYGVALGILLPIIGFFVYWSWRQGDKNWDQYLNFILASSANRNEPLIFPMVPNLILFYFSNFMYRLDNFTVGLVGTTIVLVIPVVISLVL
jgi:hypothetical protein